MTEQPKRHFPKKLLLLIPLFLIIIIIPITCHIFQNKKTKPLPKKEKISTPKRPIIAIKHLKIVDEKSNKRPIAIMIDNNIGPSNHIGLNDAYLTYEVLVEGGLTRIMAIFKDKTTEEIGPVRSSRHYFLDYALESDAIYAHFGWSPYAQEDIKKLSVNNINGLTNSSAYWRNNSISAPHNVFTSIEKLYEESEKYNYSNTTTNWHLLNYSTDEIELSSLPIEDNFPKKASKIIVKYSNYQTRTYTYDDTTKKYLRFMNNEAHTDKKTNEQYSYKNIIIEKVNSKLLDSSGRLDLDTTGTKDGYYMTNGHITPIKCTKETRNSKTIYKYLDDAEIKVNDGNTLIQIIPLTADIEIFE